MLYSFKRFFVTVSYLKSKQVYYRIYYILRNKIRLKLNIKYAQAISSNTYILDLEDSLPQYESMREYSFTFLNKTYQYKNKIDWNFNEYGKLWTYNLTYFDYLNQKNITQKKGLRLINDFIDSITEIKDGLEPFPISLRGLNWIKFINRYKINNKKMNNSLYAQYHILVDNIEYHLLGNHLLENAFSLLFASYYFKDENFYLTANKILKKELNEQILSDGAHFELSPMYHQLMLFRLLDCINLLQRNSWKKDDLLKYLTSKASVMLGWLERITFLNGDIPLLNDSAEKIAPPTAELISYARRLNIEIASIELNDCGYRKIVKAYYECIVDIGNIGPDYIPGHAHSDTFNFLLFIRNKPFIIDVGTSTYEVNELRQIERSTISHNTVMLNHTEQSKVWGGFRVAERAKVIRRIEKENYICAIHDGYKKRFNALHQREFYFENNVIKIVDTIDTLYKYHAVSRLHFAKDVILKKEKNIVWANEVQIIFSTDKLKIKPYSYTKEFNQEILSNVLEISFIQKVSMEIKL